MTQEQKDLLIKDLSARLPYGVKLKIKIYEDINEIDGIGTLYQLNKKSVWILEDENERCLEYNKPYLFPMSSMTEEQRKEYGLVLCGELSINQYDWLNAHHFDYRGLIPMGLANDATGLNIY